MAEETSKRTITPAGMPQSQGSDSPHRSEGSGGERRSGRGFGRDHRLSDHLGAEHQGRHACSRSAGPTRRSSTSPARPPRTSASRSRCRPRTDDALLNRLVTQPESLDIADTRVLGFLMYTVPRGMLAADRPEQVSSGGTRSCRSSPRGEYPDGRKVSRQGILPVRGAVRRGAGRDASSPTGPTGWATAIPTVYNADTLGHPPRPGRAADRALGTSCSIPSSRARRRWSTCPRSASWTPPWRSSARGDIKYGDKGNMTKDGDRQDDRHPDRAKKAGHFRAFWTTFDESVNLMASGEVVIQSMWSPAVTAVRSRGIPCFYVPLKEGYRGWGSGIAPMAHLNGPQARRRLRVPQLVPVRLAGRLHRQAGLLQLGARDRQAVHDRERVGLLVRGQAGAGARSRTPTATVMEKAGQVRDGGSSGSAWARSPAGTR